MIAYMTWLVAHPSDDGGVVHEEKDLCWHVGETTERIKVVIQDPSTSIKAFQADGHELEHIIEQFPNLIYAKNKRVNVWRGSIAHFIAEHL